MWTPGQQRRLAGARVGIGGIGGVGAAQGLLLSKAGVGFIRIADRDTYEPENIVEQAFATWDVVGQPKVEVAAREMARHQKKLRVEVIQGDLSSDLVARRLVAGTDLVLSGVDNPAARVSLGRAAVRESVPFIVGANVGWAVFHVTYLPEMGGFAQTFRNIGGIQKDELGFPVLDDPVTRRIIEREWCIWTVTLSGYRTPELRRFLREELNHFSYIAPAAFAAASFTVLEGLKCLLRLGDVVSYPDIRVFDLRSGKALSNAEVHARYAAVSEAWDSGEQAVLKVIRA